MAQLTQTQESVAEAGLPAASVQAPALNLDHTKIKGRFNQYQSGYWSLAVPLLSARYIADGINEVLKVKLNRPGMPEWADKAWAGVVAAGMMLVTGFYTKRTYGDMKRQFSEPLAWEFNKPAENVSFFDMLRSKNTLVRDAMNNFTKRTFMRFAVNLPFLSFLVPTPFKDRAPGYEDYDKLAGAKASVNLGVGSNAMYLASDALGRRRTFFEELQNFIDIKINHSDRVGELVTAADLINLYNLQNRLNGSATPLPKMNTPEWQKDLALFEHMADLMNQTYGNTPKSDYADFTAPKLIYLLGMGLVKSESLEKNLAYVDVANRYGIPAVEQVAKAVNAGADLNVALAAFPITRHEPSPEVVAEAAAPSFAKKIRPEAPVAGTFVEKTAQNTSEAGQAIG